MTRLLIHLHKILYTAWENQTYGPYFITGRKYIHFNGGDRRKGDIYWVLITT